ncbi:hypothetical protein GGR56DRAFT_659127 [Xylariaceae sp. FL0804]|nr:hypothetical protein GGR56DRAFT_659127 [Xylariaceae sp. FL0804]
MPWSWLFHSALPRLSSAAWYLHCSFRLLFTLSARPFFSSSSPFPARVDLVAALLDNHQLLNSHLLHKTYFFTYQRLSRLSF